MLANYNKKIFQGNTYSKVMCILLIMCSLLKSNISAAEENTKVSLLAGYNVFYKIGLALAQEFNTKIPNIEMNVVETKGTVENIYLIQQNPENFIAFAESFSALEAWKGHPWSGFKYKFDKLKALSNLYTSHIQLVVSEKSGISTLEDLRDKRISVGPPRSGVELDARTVLKAAGLGYQDFASVHYLTYEESSELMKKGEIDAIFQTANINVKMLQTLASELPIKILPLDDKVLSNLDNTIFFKGIIPSNTYTGQTQDIETITIPNVMLVNSDMPDEIAYSIIKQFYVSLEKMAQISPLIQTMANEIKLENAAKNLSIPLHPGAEKYYKELGLIP